MGPFLETLMLILDLDISHEMDMTIKIFSINDQNIWRDRSTYLMPLSCLKGSPRIPFTKSENLVVVKHYLIHFIHFSETPRLVNHFQLNSHFSLL